MMKAIAATLNYDLSRFSDPQALRRAALFGASWGLAFASAMTAMNLYANGCVCIDEALWTTAVSLSAGIVAIGPVTMFSSKRG
jgi:pimeloyl-ACP methyl ester carboxylesterase